MRTLTRDAQHGPYTQLLHDIITKLSTATRRLSLIESHVASIAHGPKKSTDKTRLGSKSAEPTKNTAYWREATSTLSLENELLIDRLSHAEAECAQLKHTAARCASARKALESSLNEANKEIIQLANHRRAPRPPPRAKCTVVPASLQGKDATYWHQTCRSMEAQFKQRAAELEARIDELTGRRA